MPVLLKNQDSVQLQASLAHLGVDLPLARRLQAAVVRRGELPSPGRGLTARLREVLRQETSIPRLTLLDKVVSPADGFIKYLFRGGGEEPFEAVGIPILHREHDRKYVVCVSSQVGCAMGCAFCATGRMGFRRNLAPWEMVDQVIQARADLAHPVRGVVFMGMGEPMLNYDAVMTAVRLLSEPCGLAIAAKSITISTAGIVPGIRRFAGEGIEARLVVSLTSANARQRLELMPVERAHPTPELMAALREYAAKTGQRVTLAWTMMAGVNTDDQAARELAALTRGLPVKLDLIDVNDPTGRFRPPTRDELNVFRDALRAHLGMPVARRYSGGGDIQAACGMLAGQAASPPAARDVLTMNNEMKTSQPIPEGGPPGPHAALRPAVFLDRDGTIIEDCGWLREPGQAVFFPGTAAALRRLQERFRLFIVTNQSGISRGELTMEEARRVNDHVVQCLQEQGIRIEQVYCCPHQRADGCGCIKPKPFFLEKAAREHGVDLRRSYVIGDHPHDAVFGRELGVTGVFVLTGHGAHHRDEVASGIFQAPGIVEATDWILTQAS